MQYVKIFNSILHSTVWSEPSDIRVLWITMLAMADRYGEIHAAIPGLAKAAGIPLETCEVGPDKYSRTKDFDGRRIEQIEGGWRLLNYENYRKLLSQEERREYFKNKKREYRARDKSVQICPQSSTYVTQSPHIAEEEGKEEGKEGKDKQPCSPSAECEQIYAAYPKKVARGNAIKAIEKALKKVTFAELLHKTQKFAASYAGNRGQYTPHPASWFNGECYLDDPATWGETKRQSNRPKTEDEKMVEFLESQGFNTKTATREDLIRAGWIPIPGTTSMYHPEKTSPEAIEMIKRGEIPS